MVLVAPQAPPFSALTALTALTAPPRAHAGLVVHELGFELRRGRRLIDGVSFTAPAGTLTAVIGPSGAGKSTLSRLLAGLVRPSSGEVRFDEADVWEERHALTSRIGLVPQDYLVHRHLTLRRALHHAASLRLPGLSAEERATRAGAVIARLGLGGVAEQRIDRLSGGQRKRASVAMELLTEPALLILDEPTSGLDPALDRQVMRSLRGLADGDRSVIVVTHSLANLDLCDQVLLLAPGGLQAYVGPPSGIASHFGTDDWGDIFESVSTRPEAAYWRWLFSAERVADVAPFERDPRRGRPERPAAPSWLRQFATVARRQIDLVLADRGYSTFLLALPFVLALLVAAVPGSKGLASASLVPLEQVGEPKTMLVLLVVGAGFLGVVLSIRDLVGERAIWRREHAAGLRPSAYLSAKLGVYGAMSVIAAGIMTFVALAVKPGPPTSVVPGLPPAIVLFVALALTAWISAALGLALSAFVASSAQVMPLVVILLMVQLVLNGGLISLVGNESLGAFSTLSPGRWAYATAASGLDLESLLQSRRPIGLGPLPHDRLWTATAWSWAFDMAVLTVWGALYAVLAWLGIRRR